MVIGFLNLVSVDAKERSKVTSSWHQKNKTTNSPVQEIKVPEKELHLNGVLFNTFKNQLKHMFFILKALKRFCSTLNWWIGEFMVSFFWCHEQVISHSFWRRAFIAQKSYKILICCTSVTWKKKSVWKNSCLEQIFSFFFQLSPNLSHLCHMNKLMIIQIFLVICSRLRIELVLVSTYYFRKVVLCSGMKPEFLEACSWLLVIHTYIVTPKTGFVLEWVIMEFWDSKAALF